MNTCINIQENENKVDENEIECEICGTTFENNEGARIHIAMHVEAMHITGASHPCDACGKKSRSGRSTYEQKSNKKIILDFNY